MLRPEFPGVNHKRVYCLYSQANLAVRRRKKAKRPISERVPLQLQLAQSGNEVWSMDFVSDSLSGGRRLKYLTVADDFSHESVDIVVDYDISGQYVTRVLDRWSGNTRNWTPIGAVTLNPERDSIIKTHSGYIDKQPLAA